MPATEQLSFWERLLLAFILPWKILFDAVFAARVARLRAAPEAPEAQRADTASALQLLGLLQREGRFVDFLQEDVASFSDQDVGAAARVVHEGCRRALEDYLVLEPVRRESEGAEVVLEKGFDPTLTRVTGNVVGTPPFRGRLAHHGWLVREIKLPAMVQGHDPTIVAPAEVEVSR